MKRIVVVLVLMAALTACGGTSQPDARVVQPCDAVHVSAVAKVLGHGLVKNTGTDADPTCVLTPVVKGGAIFKLNYQWWFQGGLAQAWKTMKGISGHVSTVKVPGADDARLVVESAKKAALVTGFVENGNLIQVVDGEALPKNAAALRRATLLLMAQVSKGAPASASAPASA